MCVLSGFQYNDQSDGTQTIGSHGLHTLVEGVESKIQPRIDVPQQGVNNSIYSSTRNLFGNYLSAQMARNKAGVSSENWTGQIHGMLSGNSRIDCGIWKRGQCRLTCLMTSRACALDVGDLHSFSASLECSGMVFHLEQGCNWV